MDISTARLIRELKKRCTNSYLAKIYYPKGHMLSESQLAGMDLCKDAAKVLGIDMWNYPLGDEEFDKENLVNGTHYWWES